MSSAFLLLIAVEFLFSSRDGLVSHSLSTAISTRIMSVLQPFFEYIKENPYWAIAEMLNAVLRKAAHWWVYLMLAFFAYFALKEWMSDAWKKYTLPIAMLCVFVIACCDEILQYFINGRTARVTDVLIDMSGAATALGIIWIYSIMRTRILKQMSGET